MTSQSPSSSPSWSSSPPPAPGSSTPSSGRRSLVGWVIAGFFVVGTALFGGLTYKRFREFKVYEAAVEAEAADGPTRPPWEDEPMSVEACVDWTLAWSMRCEGLPTLCVVHSRSLLQDCLRAGDRQSYCQAHADDFDATSFGYDGCAARREAYNVARGKDVGRAAKKHCASLYRVVAGVCQYEVLKAKGPHAAEAAGADTQGG